MKKIDFKIDKTKALGIFATVVGIGLTLLNNQVEKETKKKEMDEMEKRILDKLSSTKN